MKNRTLEEIQEDIRTLTRVPSEFIHAKLDELAEEIGELADKQWIPCSERLPEKPVVGEDCYLIQAQYVEQPFVAYWDGHNWTDECYEIAKHVIAWMPLPKPYREVDDE